MPKFDWNDAQRSKFAEMFVTINGRRYSMLNAKNFSAEATITNSPVPALGSIIEGKKPSGMEIKLSMTVYNCSDMFVELVEQFKSTGVLPRFECQVTMEDTSTTLGRSTRVYQDCIIDGNVMLSMFDVDGEFIEQTIECYAMDFITAEKYITPSYM